MRLWTVWAVLVGVLLLYSCNSDEDQLRDQAELLCKIGQLDEPNLDALPDSFDPSKHIRDEDVAFLRKKKTAYDSANSLAVGLVSMERAMTEARTKRTKCEVKSVKRRGNSATVRLQGTTPRPNYEVLTLVKEISGIADYDARVKKADSLLAKGRLITTKYQLNFVKTKAGWLADLQLPENAAKERAAAERNKKIEKAKTNAQELIEWCEWDEAKAKLLQLQKIIPSDTDIPDMIKKIDEALKTRIAGNWFEQKDPDAKTDKQNIYVKLRATRNVNSGYFRDIPALVARCVDGQLELLVVVNEVIDSTFFIDAKLQYHFGEEPPESVVVNPSTDHQSLFFPEPKKWMELLMQKTSDSLVVEIPLLDEIPKAVPFKLEGADKAIGEVLNACPK